MASIAFIGHVAPGLEQTVAGLIDSAAPGAVTTNLYRPDSRAALVRFTLDDASLSAGVFRYFDEVSALATEATLPVRAGTRALRDGLRASIEPDAVRGAVEVFKALGGSVRRRPHYRVMARTSGRQSMRRSDFGSLVESALHDAFPSWQAADPAPLEFWAHLLGDRLLLGLRLPRVGRRRVITEPGSLPASVAAVMVELAGPLPGERLLDPMCGAGTIAAELARRSRRSGAAMAGDRRLEAAARARANMRGRGAGVFAWDAGTLPLRAASVDRIVCNPPFGRRFAIRGPAGAFHRRLVAEWLRVLRPGGVLVTLTPDEPAVRDALRRARGGAVGAKVPVLVRGARALITVVTRS